MISLLDRRRHINHLLRAVARQATKALEICLESDRLTWDAEHDARIAVERAKKVV
jgi:hypothetical protein